MTFKQERLENTMCKWGNQVQLDVEVPAWLSCTGEARRKTVGVDACIAGLVEALNNGGVKTAASCCGHGHLPASIILSDDRWVIVTDRRTALKFFSGYDKTITGESRHE